MNPWRDIRSLCAPLALTVAVPLMVGGCFGDHGRRAGVVPVLAQGGPPSGMGNSPGGPPGMGGPPPGMGGPGMGGPPPGMGSGPGMGGPGMGGPGMGGPGMGSPAGGAPAAGGGTPAADGIAYNKMPFVAKPKPVKWKGGKWVASSWAEAKRSPATVQLEFRYLAKGDPEALLPFLNRPGSGSPEEGSVWFVRMPFAATAGSKTPGEWEDLFCTYVVPDTAAIHKSAKALQAKLSTLRKRIYRQRIYTVDVMAGDRVPQTAQVQTRDAVASAMRDPAPRLMLYLDLTQRAIDAHRLDQAKTYLAAAGDAFAAISYENGRHGDALWMYQEVPKRIR